MSLVDEFQTALQTSSSFELLSQNEKKAYNSLFRENGYSITPAKWRMNICRLISILLKNKTVEIQFIMCELQKYLNAEKYGFNGDLTMFLAQYNVPINSVIMFRGIKCTLLHAIVTVCGGFNLSKNNETFHNYMIKNKPITDVKDEYGRTALSIAVWNLSKPTPSLNEVNVIRCLIEYGFNPFIKYRGITIFDKLSKICEMVKQNAYVDSDDSKENMNTSKAIHILLETHDKIKYFRERVVAIQSSLKNLVHKNIIIDDIADVIQDCVGISHYTKRKIQQTITPYSKKSLKQRIKLLSRSTNSAKSTQN